MCAVSCCEDGGWPWLPCKVSTETIFGLRSVRVESVARALDGGSGGGCGVSGEIEGPVPPILKLEIGGARRASSQRERERGVKWRQQGSSAPSLKEDKLRRERGFWACAADAPPPAQLSARERDTHRATALDWTALRCWIFRHAAATWRCTGNSHCTRTFALSRSSLGQRGEQQQQQQLRSVMQSHARLAITSFSPHSNVAHLQHSYRHRTSISLPSYSAAARLASSLLQPSSATSTPSGLAIPAHQPKPS